MLSFEQDREPKQHARGMYQILFTLYYLVFVLGTNRCCSTLSCRNLERSSRMIGVKMKVHETRSYHAPAGDEDKVMTRKKKAEQKANEAEQSPKKPKSENDGSEADKSDSAAEFEEFCKATGEHLSADQMREILEANGLDSSGPDLEVARTCQDVMFYGLLEKCPICGGNLMFDGVTYSCKGAYSEWASCIYRTKNPPRKKEQIKLPDSVLNSPVSDLLKKYQDPSNRSEQRAVTTEKPFLGMMISLMGRLSRANEDWKKEIEKHGGKVHSSVLGVHCLVVSPAEREHGGSGKLVEAMERGVPVVSENWLIDSIKKQEPQPLAAYNVVVDLAPEGKGVPWDKMDPSEEAIESISAELKLYGKRAVYKDTRLREQDGQIFEKDGILYNCAFSLCDQGRGINDYCIMQLIQIPEGKVHLYYKKGRVGDDPNAEERLEEWEDTNGAVKEFVRLFEEVTGNEFEPWEREKKFQKKLLKFYPVDMDDGVDVRYGGLGLRQLGVAATHCKLDPMVANFMKVLCGQDIYRYALMEMGLDSPDLPVGMLSSVHLKRCEEALLEFIEKVKSLKEKDLSAWTDFSQRWFTLMHSTRPFIFKDHQDLADNAAAAFETVRDIVHASHLIGDMGADTLDDLLSDRYQKLGCSVTPLEKDSDDYKMIVNYLEKTYELVKLADVEYGATVENIFVVDPNGGPSFEEVKKLPNKILVWCGSRSANMLRHLHKGLLPAVCSLPAPGYMLGPGIVCSDAAAEAARYGFTAVDRPEGFLILAVFSQGEQVIEMKSPPEDMKSLHERKVGVKGLGRKKTDESEHMMWNGDIKVPCGRLVPSEHKDSPLEFNEYVVFDPKQVMVRFVVGVKYEEEGQ